MLTTASALLLAAALAGPQQPDTTITVPAGTRLDVHAQGGEIVVRAWDRNEVRVQASYGSRDQVRVTTSGSVVRVRSDSSRGAVGIVDYLIMVPAAMNLELGGVFTDISVENTRGQVRANTVQGDVTLRGGAGQIVLETVQGDVNVEGTQGDVQAKAVSGQVRLRNVRGAIDAVTVSGGVVLEGVESTQVSVSSVSGGIFYDGTLADAGRYSFASHSGRVTIAVPEPLNATVTVATLSGSFSTTLTSLTTNGSDRGRRQTFTAGSGGAMVEAESFSGNIRLLRRGEVTPR